MAHHLGFPSFALHNIISGCAVPGHISHIQYFFDVLWVSLPGTVVACYTELTIFFTSSYWIAKMAGVHDFWLLPIKIGMVTSTMVTWALPLVQYRSCWIKKTEFRIFKYLYHLYLYISIRHKWEYHRFQTQKVVATATVSEVLRGGLVLLLDVRAVFNDQSQLPVASWLVQAPKQVVRWYSVPNRHQLPSWKLQDCNMFVIPSLTHHQDDLQRFLHCFYMFLLPLPLVGVWPKYAWNSSSISHIRHCSPFIGGAKLQQCIELQWNCNGIQ